MIPLLVSHRLCAALAMAGALLASNLATAQTPCFQWDVTQPWVALQDNDYTVEMHLTRQGPDLGGTAKITSPGRTGIIAPFRAVLNARVTGTLENAAIELGRWRCVREARTWSSDRPRRAVTLTKTSRMP